ncbi:DUF1127 domain-containing protein [Puniceibacterium sediminis]|uniref:YjiS-like domain-containing protein n=1 Tax=Puniceibacterium sediminis TaxID=1608407 RepID=A0A238YHC9_9RHOB|nr:DUF1127 domain-containing protein [Puniceibacterium sediminis]SNR70605.1 protein of unknown function [Puniceibacterium sediminis]
MTPASHAPHIAFLSAESHLAPLPAFALFAAVVLTKWSSRHRTRKALARLEPHLLKDIGLDSQTARHEASRMFWQG